MPEGDTVHKIANFLAPRLKGMVAREVRLADPSAARQCTGRRVSDVHARGKKVRQAMRAAYARPARASRIGQQTRFEAAPARFPCEMHGTYKVAAPKVAPKVGRHLMLAEARSLASSRA